MTLNEQLSPDFSIDEVCSVLEQLEHASLGTDPQAQQLFSTLKGVAHLVLQPDDERSPFRGGWHPRPEGGVQQGPSSSEEYQWLRSAVDQIRHAGLRARIADLLWLLTHEALFPRKAIDAYMQYAQDRDDTGINASPHDVTDGLRRAAILARQLGKKNPQLDQVLRAVEEGLERHRNDDQYGWYSHALFKVMIRFKRGDPAVLAEQAAAFARRCEELGNWPMARTHWDNVATFHHLSKHSEQAQQAKLAAAEAFTKSARSFIRPGSPPFLAVKELKQAVQALRQARATPKRIQDVLQEIRVLQSTEGEFMQTFSTEIPSDVVVTQQQSGRAQVTGLMLPSALQQLGRLAVLPSLSELKRAAQDTLQSTVFHRLATTNLTDQAGRLQETLSTQEEYLTYQINQQAAMARLLSVIAIDAAVAQLHHDHTIGLHDLAFIVTGNARIPVGHEDSVQRGLWYGLEGDFLAAIPILLPQLEAGLRHLVNTSGVVTSGLDHAEVQQEHTLNALLTEEKYTSVFNQALGELFVFDLRFLLVEKVGENLRNVSAHGLALDGQLNGTSGRYTWAVLLRFFMDGLL
ncbi:DUF4209 domain-containing protein [Deinococcus sp. QL22]|uniref:DUF4209 domain-containing protein n=1 Tax=Deinococcus sp. QL22 TaxID=2939437 RepID=UPI0020172FE0|nr:DUF4209 domain-containing protein [Deinococcus sp. QL22]UQN08426.1 DUF4209 domain-containing protein [Deinococcus sp. QL22]